MSQRYGDGDVPDHDLPELPPEWGPLVIPDDARELAAEAEAVRAELWAARNAGRRTLFTRGWRRFGLSGPLIALVLMLVAAIASLTVIALPYHPVRPRPAPLASTGTATGQLGGLLPDVRLLNDHHRAIAVRHVRPAVLLLMPAGCDCDDVAADLVRSSRDALIAVELVGVTAPPARPASSPRDRVHTLADPTDTLGRAVHTDRSTSMGPVVPRTAPTAVLVRSNGLIAGVVPGLSDASQLRAELAGLTIS